MNPTNITDLPPEIICMILSNCNLIDTRNLLDVLGWTDMRLSRKFYKKISLRMDYRFHERLVSPLIHRIKQLVVHLDMTGIYWVSASVIRNIVRRLPNLHHVEVLGTKVVLNHGNYRLFGNAKITKVSVSQTKALNTTQFAYHLVMCTQSKGTYHDTYNTIYPSAKWVFEIINNPVAGYLPIVDENWVSTMASLYKDKQYDKEIQRMETIVINLVHTDFYRLTEMQIKDQEALLKDYEIVYIRHSYLPRAPDLIQLDSLMSMPNLRSLHLDITSRVSKRCLKTIFEGCPNLSKLHIRCYEVNWSFVHLKYAQRLKDLSIRMYASLHFNVEKFFFDLNANKTLRLRRLYLCFYQTEAFTGKTLDAFMELNEQLVFIVIATLMPLSSMTFLRTRMQMHQKHPWQVFNAVQNSAGYDAQLPDYTVIPLVHWDMINDFSLRLFTPNN